MAPSEIDRETLESQDGREGRPARVAANGKVYDVSGSKLWKDGVHMSLHRAGQDLTDHLPMAPHGPEMLDRVSLVGQLTSEAPTPTEDTLKQRLYLLYRKFHPHPIAIHFPIALFIFAAFMDILYLIFGRPESLGATVFHAQLFASAAAPPAMASGLLSWWLNYDATLTPIFRKKIFGSLALLFVAVLTLVLRLLNPTVAADSGTLSLAYHVLVIGAWPIVAFIGFQGGKITFPS